MPAGGMLSIMPFPPTPLPGRSRTADQKFHSGTPAPVATLTISVLKRSTCSAVTAPSRRFGMVLSTGMTPLSSAVFTMNCRLARKLSGVAAYMSASWVPSMIRAMLGRVSLISQASGVSPARQTLASASPAERTSIVVQPG